MKRLSSCSIVQTLPESRRLWQFNFSDGKPVQTGETSVPAEASLPVLWVAKDLRSLWQKRINLAWFPAEDVFLRVVQLPAGDPAELPAMVELQLEKLSPLPVTQIMWAAESLPGAVDGMQTVVVVIAARARVEEYLSTLEAKGLQTDRLEVPVLHQLAEFAGKGDGVWLFPEGASGANLCLVAWWAGGVLCNLAFLRITDAENWGAVALQQLTQMAWAGQMEGWLPQLPQCHLVADEATEARWQPVLREWAGEVKTVPVKSAADLAALSASRLASETSNINLVPTEFITRFRQLLIDRIWMGGLFAAIGIYIVGVLIYFAAVQVVYYQKKNLDKAVVQITPAYTNAIQIQERIRVLEEQKNLKFAALDCWKAACVLLPAELTLNSLSLSQGKTLMLSGMVSTEGASQVFNYNEALARYRLESPNGKLLFKSVVPPTVSDMSGGAQKRWSFNCELNRTDL
jgi:hypothetical protein